MRKQLWFSSYLTGRAQTTQVGFDISDKAVSNSRRLHALVTFTRGTFRQVPARRIRLSFVECAYSDLRNIYFFHNFRGLKWIPL